MSQQDNFVGGFIFGAIAGGIVGGIVGAVAASRRQQLPEEEDSAKLAEGKGGRLNTEADMEKARRRLEDKIAQLNLAIDDVRHQLGSVNGTPTEREISPVREEG